MHSYWTTRRSRPSRSLLERVADQLAAIPSAPDERYFHEDLPELDGGALRLEHRRLSAAILFADRPSPWVLERLERIEAEMRAHCGR